MSTRKTVKVADIVSRINGMIAATPDEMTRERQALAMALETILFDANAYAGFNYLTSEWLPESERDYKAGHMLRPDYDDTRRVYATHSGLVR
jgi:hypothetical protein